MFKADEQTDKHLELYIILASKNKQPMKNNQPNFMIANKTGKLLKNPPNVNINVIYEASIKFNSLILNFKLFMVIRKYI